MNDGDPPHAFVAMPFGVKPGVDGQAIDFNRVYVEYIKPAPDAAGLTAFAPMPKCAPATSVRTCSRSCCSRTSSWLISERQSECLVRLGVRHALRARGVVLVSGGG